MRTYAESHAMILDGLRAGVVLQRTEDAMGTETTSQKAERIGRDSVDATNKIVTECLVLHGVTVEPGSAIHYALGLIAQRCWSKGMDDAGELYRDI